MILPPTNSALPPSRWRSAIVMAVGVNDIDTLRSCTDTSRISLQDTRMDPDPRRRNRVAGLKTHIRRRGLDHFVTTNRSSSSPVAETWRTVSLGPSTSATVKRVDLGDELVRIRLPGGGVVLLVGVVEIGPAGAGDHVDHAAGPGVVAAVEGLVERPVGRGPCPRRGPACRPVARSGRKVSGNVRW